MKDHEDGQELHSDTNKRKLEENIQLAKQKAQEIVAKLVSNAESKRPRFDYESPATTTASAPAPAPAPQNPPFSASPYPVSSGTQTGPYHGFQSMSKKMSIPNIKVGLIIGKGGETIKYLQLQSGAKIQITRDFEADPQSMTRDVELMGTSEQVSRAEQLINEVIAEANSGASAAATTNQGMNSSQPGVEQFVMKVPNNKVALVIGKGGETIKSIQSKSAARVQIIPLHLPPGDTSTERNVFINGLKEQVESAKEMINEIISGKRLVNASETTSYAQPTYPPAANWSQAGQQPPLQQQQQQQPQYGYAPGAYPPPPGPPYYSNYPTQVGSWDHTNQSTVQPSEQSSGYNYYGQQSQVGSAPQYQGYSYGQPASTGTHGYDQSYSQQAPSYGQNFSGQITPYDQQNMYSGGAPPAAPSTNGISEGTYPNAAYQVSNGQPMPNPLTGYWTYPSDPTQSHPQTANDQSGYYQTVSGGQEQAPGVYGQSGHPPPPGVYSTTSAQPPSVGEVQTSGDGNSNGGQSLAPAVQGTANSES